MSEPRGDVPQWRDKPTSEGYWLVTNFGLTFYAAEELDEFVVQRGVEVFGPIPPRMPIPEPPEGSK